MNILIIGGSNSKQSINRKFALYAGSLFSNSTSEVYDLSQVSIPLFSVDLEAALGIPKEVLLFAEKIDNTDFIVLSLAENNGSFNAGFKNLIDWTSRIKNRKLFGEKSMLLMATSPGARGGASVLETAKNIFPFMGANIKGTFSLPSFYQNFSDKDGITDATLKQALQKIIDNI